MARRKDIVRRVLFVNGVRLKFGKGLLSGHLPTKGLLEEIEACHIHGNPWNGYWVEEFATRVCQKENGEIYQRYDTCMKSQRAMIG